MYIPICFCPFQDLFDSDINCLTGILFLFERHFSPARLNSKSVSEINKLAPEDPDVLISALLRPRFLAQYLTVQCLAKRGCSKQELVSAMRKLSSKYVVEQLMHKFLVLQMQRKRQN